MGSCNLYNQRHSLEKQKEVGRSIKNRTSRSSKQKDLQKSETDIYMGETKRYIGVMDCNNFFVSCERVFNPSLEGKPVVVLSNNDGCAVSRSAEAKRLGVKMGTPAFKIQKEFNEKGQNVIMCSSNYTLYADMSHRVMNVLKSIVNETEQYSVDESFIDFTGMGERRIAEKGREIVYKARKYTGIPVSVGVGESKTLAKVATYFAKHYKGYRNFCFINTELKREKALRLLPVEDVWGIGWRSSKMLEQEWIRTAWDFVQKDPMWIKKRMGINGVRTRSELLGESVLELEDVADKQSITTSRSFGDMVEDLDNLKAAVSNFAASCAEKLRAQNSFARFATVFIATNFFKKDLPQYSSSALVEFPEATNNTLEIVKGSVQALSKLYRSGFKYKKAGVVLSGIVPLGGVQQNMFVEKDYDKEQRLGKLLDYVNRRFGRGKLHLAVQGNSAPPMRREHLSANYTTSLDELIKINV